METFVDFKNCLLCLEQTLVMASEKSTPFLVLLSYAFIRTVSFADDETAAFYLMIRFRRAFSQEDLEQCDIMFQKVNGLEFFFYFEYKKKGHTRRCLFLGEETIRRNLIQGVGFGTENRNGVYSRNGVKKSRTIRLRKEEKRQSKYERRRSEESEGSKTGGTKDRQAK